MRFLVLFSILISNAVLASTNFTGALECVAEDGGRKIQIQFMRNSKREKRDQYHVVSCHGADYLKNGLRSENSEILRISDNTYQIQTELYNYMFNVYGDKSRALESDDSGSWSRFNCIEIEELNCI